MQVGLVIIISMVLALILGALIPRGQVRAVLSGVAVHAGVWMSYVGVRILPEIAPFFARMLLQAFQSTGPAMASVFSILLSEITGEEIPPSALAQLQGSKSILEAGTALAKIVVPDITGALFPDRPLTPEGARAQAERLLGVSLSFSLDSWADHTVLELTSLGQLSWAADVSEAVMQGLGLQRVTRRAMQTIYGRAIAEPLEAYLNTLYRPTRLRATEIIDAWQQQLIDDNAALEALAQEGYSYERAILLMNARQRDFTQGDMQALLEMGAIDESALERWARRQGYGDARAGLLLQRMTRYRVRALREDLADTARRIYRGGIIDDEELRTILRGAGYRDAEVDLVLVREALELRDQKQLTPAQITAAYREGTFDATEARDRLRALRYADDAIDVLLSTETKRLTPAQIIDALTRGIIPEATARQRLEATGYRPEDIDVLLDLRIRRLTAGQVIDAVARGLLEPQAARRLLEQAGFTAETVDLLLAFQRRTLSVADVTAALVRGIIGEPDALGRLLTLGYSREDAAVVLQLRFQLLSTGQILDAYDAGLVTRRSTVTRLQALGFSLDDAELLLQVFEGKQAREGRPRPPAG